MEEDSKNKLNELVDASVVIAVYLNQQVRNGAISQTLYKKNIQRFLVALNEFMEIKDDWK